MNEIFRFVSMRQAKPVAYFDTTHFSRSELLNNLELAVQHPDAYATSQGVAQEYMSSDNYISLPEQLQTPIFNFYSQILKDFKLTFKKIAQITTKIFDEDVTSLIESNAFKSDHMMAGDSYLAAMVSNEVSVRQRKWLQQILATFNLLELVATNPNSTAPFSVTTYYLKPITLPETIFPLPGPKQQVTPNTYYQDLKVKIEAFKERISILNTAKQELESITTQQLQEQYEEEMINQENQLKQLTSLSINRPLQTEPSNTDPGRQKNCCCHSQPQFCPNCCTCPWHPEGKSMLHPTVILCCCKNATSEKQTDISLKDDQHTVYDSIPSVPELTRSNLYVLTNKLLTTLSVKTQEIIAECSLGKPVSLLEAIDYIEDELSNAGNELSNLQGNQNKLQILRYGKMILAVKPLNLKQ